MNHPYIVKFNKNKKEILGVGKKMISNEVYSNHIKLWDRMSGNELVSLNIQGNFDTKDIKFSKDEKEIIIWSDKQVRIYRLYRDRKLKKEFYPLEAEVESGCTLTKSGEIRVLTKEEWEEKKRRYEVALRESE